VPDATSSGIHHVTLITRDVQANVDFYAGFLGLRLVKWTGGDEADLMPLAHRIAPRATLLGVRGRSHEEGVARWFRRLTATTFDQADIRAEAAAFEAFVDGAVAGYGLDRAGLAFTGFSNGANFAAAVTALHPRTIRRAILLRCMPVLDPLPEADLAGTDILMLSGRDDPHGAAAPALEGWLRRSGARVDHRVLDAGHGLVDGDEALARAWLHDTERNRHG